LRARWQVEDLAAIERERLDSDERLTRQWPGVRDFGQCNVRGNGHNGQRTHDADHSLGPFAPRTPSIGVAFTTALVEFGAASDWPLPARSWKRPSSVVPLFRKGNPGGG